MLLHCLTDPDAEVVGEAVQALAWFPEEVDAIRPGLPAVASDDEQPVPVAGAALVALGLVGGPLTPPVAGLLDRQLGSPEPHLRWSAAVAWALLAGEEVPDPVTAELRGWAVTHRQVGEPTVWEAYPADVALQLLDRVAPAVAERVRADLVAEVLAEEPTSNWHNHFNLVLDAAFPEMDRDHGRGFAELSPAQQDVVRRLTRNPQVFGTSGPAGPLRQYGLPTTYEALRAYAGVDG